MAFQPLRAVEEQMGLAGSFRGSVRYRYGRKHGGVQTDKVLDEPRVLHLDPKAARRSSAGSQLDGWTLSECP